MSGLKMTNSKSMSTTKMSVKQEVIVNNYPKRTSLGFNLICWFLGNKCLRNYCGFQSDNSCKLSGALFLYYSHSSSLKSVQTSSVMPMKDSFSTILHKPLVWLTNWLITFQTPGWAAGVTRLHPAPSAAQTWARSGRRWCLVLYLMYCTVLNCITLYCTVLYCT